MKTTARTILIVALVTMGRHAAVDSAAGDNPGRSRDVMLLTNTEFDGLPAGIKMRDIQTGAILGFLVTEDWPDNGELGPVEALAPGPNRTVLVAQPGGDGKVARYDEVGNFLGNFIGGQPEQSQNPVDNIRGMVRSLSGEHLFTADWTGDNVHRFDFCDGAPAPVAGDPLGEFIPGQQPPPNLDQPQALEVLGNGDLLVADIAQRKLMRYDSSSGDLIGEFSSEQIVAWVTDMDEQTSGDVVIAEGGSADRIRRFSSAGVLLSTFSFDGPEGVHVLPSGDYLVTSGSTFGQGRGLFRVSPSGTILETIDDSRSYGALELVPLVGLPADLDCDGEVGLADLAQLLSNYGSAENATYADGDLDGDGDVDLSDLATLLGLYGTSGG